MNMDFFLYTNKVTKFHIRIDQWEKMNRLMGTECEDPQAGNDLSPNFWVHTFFFIYLMHFSLLNLFLNYENRFVCMIMRFMQIPKNKNTSGSQKKKVLLKRSGAIAPLLLQLKHDNYNTYDYIV